MKNPFKNWKQRCSSLGHLLTCPPGISEKNTERINELQERKAKAETFEAKPLTAKMEEELITLVAKRDAPDVLPKGVITHLDNVFRSIFWSRKRILENKYLSKGLFCEEDAIGVVSKNTGVFLLKNTEQFSNDYIEGMPDIITALVRDTKANWDMDTFDTAELTKLYEGQLKGYCWLTNKDEASLDYCLVNSPEHLITAAKMSVYYAMNSPGEEHPKYLENCKQIEKNMIFDIPLFKKQNPHYDFHNDVLDFDVPVHMRQKSFKVKLEEGDTEFIKGRVILAREYLCNKYEETMSEINNPKRFM